MKICKIASEQGLCFVDLDKVAVMFYEQSGCAQVFMEHGPCLDVSDADEVQKLRQVLELASATHFEVLSELPGDRKTVTGQATYDVETVRQILDPDDEKNRRVYYQSIVYDVCRLIENFDPWGSDVVCGMADEPSREVQDRLQNLLERGKGAVQREPFPKTGGFDMMQWRVHGFGSGEEARIMQTGWVKAPNVNEAATLFYNETGFMPALIVYVDEKTYEKILVQPCDDPTCFRWILGGDFVMKEGKRYHKGCGPVTYLSPDFARLERFEVIGVFEPLDERFGPEEVLARTPAKACELFVERWLKC